MAVTAVSAVPAVRAQSSSACSNRRGALRARAAARVVDVVGPKRSLRACLPAPARAPRLGHRRAGQVWQAVAEEASEGQEDGGGRPRRVGIVGGGPAGLSLAHALLTLPTGVEHVQVLEQAAEVRSAVGGGFNINGGAAVLSDLGLGDALKTIANPMLQVKSRAVNGVTLFDFPTTPFLPAELMRDGEPLPCTVMREDLLKILNGAVPEGVVRPGRRVAAVQERGGAAVVEFADGEEEEFDLVVGCDGIKSVVREAVGAGAAGPKYSGLRIMYGVAPSCTRPAPPSEVHQWFADGAYALCYTAGAAGGQQDLFALVTTNSEEMDPNDEWDANQTREECVRICREKNLPPEVLSLVESCDERFFELGVYYHDTLPRWSSPSGRVALLGDSAHAMPPFMGQGANQAIQDAYCLAKQLCEMEPGTSSNGAASSHATLPDALKAYEDIRKPPTAQIMQTSRFIGWLETQGDIGAILRDAAFWIAGKLQVPPRIFVNSAVPRV